MANHKSALKRIRQNEKRRLRNKAVRTRLRSQRNKFERAEHVLSVMERAVASNYMKEFNNTLSADSRFEAAAEAFTAGDRARAVEIFQTIAADSFREAQSELMHAASKGVIPRARASRKTSRLALRLDAFNARAEAFKSEL